MKRAAVIGIVVGAVLVVGVGAGVAVSLAGGEPETAASTATPSATPTSGAEPSPTAETEASPEPEATTEPEADAVTPGAYIPYSESALAAAEGTRVLFFHASWCPQCHALEDSIEAEGVPDGVTILKVDYDSNTALRQQYDVRQQTTVVALDDAGAAAASFVPYDDPTLDAALAGLGLAG